MNMSRPLPHLHIFFIGLASLLYTACGVYPPSESCIQGQRSNYSLDGNYIKDSGKIKITYSRALCDYGSDFDSAKKSLVISLNGDFYSSINLPNDTLSGVIDIDASKLNVVKGRNRIPVAVDIDVQPKSFNLTRSVLPKEEKDSYIIVDFGNTTTN